MVISAPTVENGQWHWLCCVLLLKSGSKEMSKGLKKGCDAQMFSRSVWMGVVGDM
jgi:hypothetical protein